MAASSDPPPPVADVRSYSDADHAAVAWLFDHGMLCGEQDVGDTAADLDFMREAFFSSDRDHFWVAETGGKVVGCVGVAHDGGIAQIRRLRVAPEFHHSSLPTELLDTALRHCKAVGSLKVVLDTRMEADRAINLIQDSGFQFAGGKHVAGKEVLEFYFNLYRQPDEQQERLAGTQPSGLGRGKAAASSPRGAHPAGIIRVLLADDHKALRESLLALMADQADLQIVGEAADGEEALVLTHRLEPDVVVMDVTMPRLNGIEATRALRRKYPKVRVVGLSMHEKHEVATSMLEAGADAYLPKDAPPRMLLAAIRGRTTSPEGGDDGGAPA